MTLDIVLVLSVLGVTIFLFVSEWIKYPCLLKRKERLLCIKHKSRIKNKSCLIDVILQIKINRSTNIQ